MRQFDFDNLIGQICHFRGQSRTVAGARCQQLVGSDRERRHYAGVACVQIRKGGAGHRRRQIRRNFTARRAPLIGPAVARWRGRRGWSKPGPAP